MNFNTSPIAFFPSRAAQIWRAWFAQRKISVICGSDLLPFYIIDNGSAPSAGELYDPNTDTKIADIDFQNHLLDHDISVDGQSAHVWIYQGEMAGVFGRMNPGYYYLKIGNWYSDVFRIGSLASEYTEISWQFFDDIITADGTPISKHIKYKQIFETPLWHPEYNVEEEGKTNAGIFFAMQQTTKKTSGFSAIVNESQLDCLNLTRMADNITIKACLNGTTKTLQTNQFEISSKWQSDDVASIDCSFDLFSIIRKYQQSNVEPDPLPVPVPPPPPANYYIKGTATGNSVQMWINGTLETIAVNNGEFAFAYDSALTQFANYRPFASDYTKYAQNVITLDFSESCGLSEVEEFELENMVNLTSVNFAGCTFEKLTGCMSIVSGSKVTTLSLPDATFDILAESAIYNGVTITTPTGLFRYNSQLTSVSIPNADLKVRARSLFEGCANLQTVNMPLATFDTTTDASFMFYDCANLQSIDLSATTFANLKKIDYMFQNAGGLPDPDTSENTFIWGDVLPSSVAEPTSASGMFKGSKFLEINLDALDMSNVVDFDEGCASAIVRTFSMNAGDISAIANLNKAFKNCLYLNSRTTTFFDAETFAAATNVKEMFYGANGVADNLTLNAATFASVTDTESMFESCQFKKIIMPTATFANVTSAVKMFYNCNKATEIDLSATTFASLTACSNIFNNCNALQTLKVPTGSTMPCAFSLSQSASLTVDSFNTLSQWVYDYSAGSIYYGLTVNSSAWNGWSSLKYTAETRLNAKKWNVIH